MTAPIPSPRPGAGGARPPRPGARAADRIAGPAGGPTGRRAVAVRPGRAVGPAPAVWPGFEADFAGGPS